MHTAYVVVDLGYGDAGKGSLVDALVRHTRADLVVRFNGGCQAAHNVVLPDGRSHTFSQFGSGSFVPGVKTYLSEHFLWNPISMEAEAQVLVEKGLSDVWARTIVDDRALVVTPWHRAMNRLREHARGNRRHGSCGVGIGEAVEDRINPEIRLLAGDLRKLSVQQIAMVLDNLAKSKRRQFTEIENSATEGFPLEDLRFLMNGEAPFKCAHLYKDIMSRVRLSSEDPEWTAMELGGFNGLGNIVFEGAQGVLIDETYGFAPHTTWSKCTSHNALNLLSRLGWEGGIHVIGALRAYAIRHGAGPFVTEEHDLVHNRAFQELHNDYNPWQGYPRLGYFDAVAAHYALQADRHIDSLAITNLDRFAAHEDLQWKICTKYLWSDGIGPLVFEPPFRWTAEVLNQVKPEYGIAGTGMAEFPGIVGELLTLPVSIESRGPTHEHKVFRL